MADTVEIVTGDDAIVPLRLWKRNTSGVFVTFTIDPGATIKAKVISAEHTLDLLAETTLAVGAAGANWASSLVVIEWTSAETALAKLSRNALIEVEVDDTVNTNGKLTWFHPCVVTKGRI